MKEGRKLRKEGCQGSKGRSEEGRKERRKDKCRGRVPKKLGRGEIKKDGRN